MLAALGVKPKIVFIGFSACLPTRIDVPIDSNWHGDRLRMRRRIVRLLLKNFRLVSYGKHHFVQRPPQPALHAKRKCRPAIRPFRRVDFYLMRAIEVHSAYRNLRRLTSTHAQRKDAAYIRERSGIDAVEMIHSSAFLPITDRHRIDALFRQSVSEHGIWAILVFPGLS